MTAIRPTLRHKNYSGRKRNGGRAALASHRKRFGLGFVLVLLAACCWSLGGLFVRSTIGIDAWQIIFYRSLVVLVTMGGYMALRHRSHVVQNFREAGLNAFFAGIALGLAGLTFVMSLFYTTVAQAIFMAGIAPFTAAVMAWWILGERINRATWVAMIIALSGLAVMLWGTTAGGFSGNMLALFSAFCFSCYSVLLRWGQRIDMTASIVWNAVFLTVFCAVVLLFPNPLRDGGGLADLAVGWRNFLIILAMGLIQLSLGLVLFTRGSKTVPAAELALLALAEPMISPIWVWLAFGEVPAVTTLIGGAVILSALAFQILATTRQSARGATARGS